MSSPKPPPRAAAAIFMVAIVAVDAMGIGLIMPVLPELLSDIAGLDVAEAAPWGGWMAFAYGAAIFLFGPLMGDLSDRYGRRPVLIIALAALAVDYLIAAAAQTLWLLILARALSGMAGATYATATAYLADITPPEKRAGAFALVGAGFGAGFILGPSLGGLLGELGPRAPFLAASALCAVMAVASLRLVPESLPPERRRAFDIRRADPFSALRGAAKLRDMRALLTAHTLFSLAFGVYPAIWSFWAIRTLGWSPAMIGLSLGLVGVFLIASQTLLVGRMVARLGEARTVVVAVASGVSIMVVYAAGPPGWLVLAVLPFTALSAAAEPAIASYGSQRVGEDEQGRLQGVIVGLQALTSAIAPPLFASVFAVFAAKDAPVDFPGAPFVLAALISLGAIAAIVFGGMAKAPAKPAPAETDGASAGGTPAA